MSSQGQSQIAFSYMALLSVTAKLPPATITYVTLIATPCSHFFPTKIRAEKVSCEWHHCSFKHAAGGGRLYLLHGRALPGTLTSWRCSQHCLCAARLAAQTPVINANPQHSPVLLPVGFSTSAPCFIQGHSSGRASIRNPSLAVCRRLFIAENKSCQGAN